MGGANLDLREARFPPGVIDIEVTAVMGGINIVVPPGLAVQMHGSAIFGGFADINRAPANPDPDAPLLRVHGLTMMGGVNVEMRLPGESERGARRRGAARAARRAAGAAPAGSRAMSAHGEAPATGSPRCWPAAPSWCARSGWASGWWRARTSATFPPGSSGCPPSATRRSTSPDASADIDARVRERLRAGAPLYEIDEALLASLAPDVIVTQTHCEVCAVSPGDLAHGTPARSSNGARWWRWTPAPSTASSTASRRWPACSARPTPDARWSPASARGSRRWPTGRARCRCPGRRSPASSGSIRCSRWATGDRSWSRWRAGTCALGVAGAHSTTLPWPALRAADPDVIVVAPCGFGVDRTLAEMPALAAHPDWPALAAVRAGRVYVADGNLYFNRSGPLLFDTPEILAEMLHPAAFPPAHEGAIWRRWVT